MVYLDIEGSSLFKWSQDLSPISEMYAHVSASGRGQICSSYYDTRHYALDVLNVPFNRDLSLRKAYATCLRSNPRGIT